ncbi:rhomboid family intramembrane serine protease [Streptomyces sp. NRRL S-87]|uniref:rhomboid family intramembrane serine protease n=1 Tax=Streptomyces sp. NRRL S-87 TaxID=1463920 RepID=UPI0004C14F33|nr:rhomboid family intramembrane serine protease [Streptomyces sp. NRRL S-87]
MDTQRLPGCYRHPDRQTGIRCTRCERPICPDCMVDASVGFQCPECVRTGSGTGHAPAANQPRTVGGGPVAAGDPALVTKILIGINVAVFIAVRAIGGPPAHNDLVNRFSMLGQAWSADPLQGGVVEGVATGEWYRLLTSMFLHEEIWHIGFNMLSLWFLGPSLEAALGRARYLALYLVSGLAGSALVYLLAEPNVQTLGASGAIYGLFGATAVLMRRMRYDMRPVIALLVINLVITFGWSGISWQAHVGGLVAGVLIAVGMVHAPREHRSLVQWGTCGLVLATVVVAVLLRTAALT